MEAGEGDLSRVPQDWPSEDKYGPTKENHVC